MTQRNNVCPDGDIVHGADVEVIGGIEAHDARDERPGAEEACGQGVYLVLGALVRGGVGRDELVDGVLGDEGRGTGGEGGVRDEEAVVEAAAVVEGQVVLGRVSD